MTSPKIELGKRYRDKVSGWEGTATGRYEFLNGCVRFEIAGADKDGKPAEFVFDEGQLEPLDAPALAVAPRRRTGGPRGSAPVARH